VALKGEWVQEKIKAIWPSFSALKADQLDVSEVSRIDSAGLAAIITVFMAQNGATPFTIRHSSPELQQLLALYGLDELVTLASSEQRHAE
jgi:ABC-type transporter Mla MlaB component